MAASARDTLAAGVLFAPQNKPPEVCTISGFVVDSVAGVPLNKVQVLAQKAANDRSAPAYATTDAKGAFTLVQLERGHYRLKGVRNGYLETYYGARRADSKGITLALETGQELKDLQLKLLPFAVIGGTVRDAEGEPLAGAAVALLTLTYGSGQLQVRSRGEKTLTDDLGQYRIANIAPGRTTFGRR